MPTQNRGPRIDPGSPEYAWVARVVAAVERRAGVATRWNGELYQETVPDALGAAHPDGSMSLSVADVIEPVRRAHTERDLTAEDLELARDALATVVHEAVHLSTHDGDPSLPGAHPADDAPAAALDEGVIENWTRDNLDRVIYDLDLDQAVPGIVEAPTAISYPAYSAAARGLVDGVAQLTGQPPAQVADRIRTTELSQRWNRIADLAIGGPVPPTVRQAIREHLAEGLRAGFARIQDLEYDPGLDDAAKARQGLDAGRCAAGDLELAVRRLRAGDGAADQPRRALTGPAPHLGRSRATRVPHRRSGIGR